MTFFFGKCPMQRQQISLGKTAEFPSLNLRLNVHRYRQYELEYGDSTDKRTGLGMFENL